MSDNHIITVPVNGQLQPENQESDLTQKYRAILANNASSGLDLKSLQKKEAQGKANLIASMSEIKTDVFTPLLLDEFSKAMDDVRALDTKIHTLDNLINKTSSEIYEGDDVQAIEVLRLKKECMVSDRFHCNRERADKAKYILDICDQIAYKETFKDKGPKKEDMPGGYGAMMAAMMAGAGAGIANAATDKANAAIKEKAKSKKPKQPRGYNSINPDLEKMFKN